MLKKKQHKNTPLSLNEIKNAFQICQNMKHIILAVSGGSDSVALALCAQKWKRDLNKKKLHTPKITIATVDHKLRVGSGKEAHYVKQLAQKLNFNHITLKWEGEKPKSAIQMAARNARYALLHQCQNKIKADAVLTAHHLQDQAETLIMRLARGGGVDGLSAMKQQTMIQNTRIIRPFLDIPSARLMQTVKKHQIQFHEDPTNQNIYFERVKLRQKEQKNARKILNLTDHALARTARRMQRARDALEKNVEKTIQKAAIFSQAGFCNLNMRILKYEEEEIILRIMMHILNVIGDGSEHNVQMGDVEKLIPWIKNHNPENNQTQKRTLHGCCIAIKKYHALIARETGRMKQKPIKLKVGEEIFWDKRFIIAAKQKNLKKSEKIYHIEPLKQNGWQEIAKYAKRPKWPAFVAHTLPAIRYKGTLVACPPIQFNAEIQKKHNIIFASVFYSENLSWKILQKCLSLDNENILNA